MAVITVTNAPEKGVAGQLQLNKSELSSVTSVSNDAYFSDPTNWNQVVLYYESTEGNQSPYVMFDATETTPVAEFFVTDKARDVFQLKYLLIKDFDGGTLRVNRSELNTADFDLDLTPAPSVLAPSGFSYPQTSYSLDEIGDNQFAQISGFPFIDDGGESVSYLVTETDNSGAGVPNEGQLNVDITNGIIQYTPGTTHLSGTYVLTITASNSVGETSTTVTVEIIGASVSVPSSFSYFPDSLTQLRTESAIVELTTAPSIDDGGEAPSYSILTVFDVAADPAFPFVAGVVTIDPSTGRLTYDTTFGANLLGEYTFTIEATNSAGSVTANVTVTFRPA